MRAARRLAAAATVAALALGVSAAAAAAAAAPGPAAAPASRRASALDSSVGDASGRAAAGQPAPARRRLPGGAPGSAGPLGRRGRSLDGLDGSVRALQTAPARRRLLGAEPGNAGPAGSLRVAVAGDTARTGYYSAELTVGSRPFTLVVDTGSAITFVPCGSCGPRCGPHSGAARVDLRGSPSAERVGCMSPTCQGFCDHAGACACSGLDLRPGYGVSSLACTYSTRYAEGSSTSGLLFRDTLRLGPAPAAPPPPQNPVAAQRALLQVLGGGNDGNGAAPDRMRAAVGCTTFEEGELKTQDAAGILGLANNPVSVLAQLAEAGVVRNKFALCLGAGGAEGSLVLGEAPGGLEDDPRVVWTPQRSFARNPGLYGVNLRGLGLGRNVLPLAGAAKEFVILDSGTTFLYLPSDLHHRFARQVLLQYDQAQTRLLVGREAARLRFENHCFRVGYGFAEVGAHFPPLKLLVEGPGGATATVELGAQNYLFEHPTTSGVVCVGVLDNGPDGGVVLGGITMADVLVMHDNENGRIGWLPRDCGALPQS